AGAKNFPIGATSVGNNLTVAGGVLTNNGSVTVTSNFTLGVAATLVSSSNTSVGGLIFNSGASINAASSSTVTIGGNFTGAGDYTSSGTTTFNGTIAMDVTGTKSFQDLVVNGTSMTPGLNINYTVNGNISGTGTLNAGTGTSTAAFGGTSTILLANVAFKNIVVTGTLNGSSGQSIT